MLWRVVIGVPILGVLAGAGIIAVYSQLAKQYDLTKLGEMPQRTVVLDANGQMIGRMHGENRIVVPLDQVSPWFIKALLVREDARFYQHGGIDFPGVVRAMLRNLKDGRIVQGASTITMQLARNLFLWPGGGFARKGVEAATALAIDALWPKRRQIEVYLNIVEWAPGVYGAEAAARHHFRKSAAQLSGHEAALLAATLPSPRKWSAGNPGSYVQNRAATLQQRAGTLGPLVDCIKG